MDLLAVQSLEREEVFYLNILNGAVVFDHGDGLGDIERAFVDAADADAPHEFGVIERCDLGLQGAGFDVRRGDVLEYGVQ